VGGGSEMGGCGRHGTLWRVEREVYVIWLKFERWPVPATHNSELSAPPNIFEIMSRFLAPFQAAGSPTSTVCLTMPCVVHLWLSLRICSHQLRQLVKSPCRTPPRCHRGDAYSAVDRATRTAESAWRTVPPVACAISGRFPA
jgi:hypothetical protein